ncbi:hypothetical protein HOY80DRAFT_1038129 [Tuber brumale]|nr:hypothetical protein HOY80DRAFT_1038129 [Tuber brumale]
MPNCGSQGEGDKCVSSSNKTFSPDWEPDWSSSVDKRSEPASVSVDLWQILTAGGDPDGSPTIAFEEFFAGNCPPGIDPEGSIVLDLEMLQVLAREEILAFGRLPDE